MHLKSKQLGLYSAEFAIVGLLFFVILFTVFEVGRLFFVYNALEESTRRGARMAAVCQVNDPAIAQIAVFNNSGDTSASGLVPGLTPAHINVQYLDENGAAVDPTAAFLTIEFVQVSITNFNHQFIIPTHFTTFQVPDFAATLPRESLGVSRDGFTPC